MPYTIASILHAEALSREQLITELIHAGVEESYWRRWTHDELITTWLRHYGDSQPEEHAMWQH